MADADISANQSRFEVRVTVDSHFVWGRIDFLALAGAVISIWQYTWTTRYLRGGWFTPIAGLKQGGMQSPVIAVAVRLTCIGLFPLGAVMLRLV